MRVVVSDTTALHYLILIGAIEVLPRIFSRVVVPLAVLVELRDPGAPATVSEWANHLPDWVEQATPASPLTLALGAGETEAIALTAEFSQSTGDIVFLTDDRKARRVARRRGLRTLGTLAVLILADEAALLKLEQAIERLRQTNFHLPEELVADAMAQARKRRDT